MKFTMPPPQQKPTAPRQPLPSRRRHSHCAAASKSEVEAFRGDYPYYYLGGHATPAQLLSVASLFTLETMYAQAGLDVVISEALYASPSIDVTSQVLTALQAKAKAPGADPARGRPARLAERTASP